MESAAIVGVAVFVVLFIFNLLWPYGETPVFRGADVIEPQPTLGCCKGGPENTLLSTL